MRRGLLRREKEARELFTHLGGNKLAIMLYKVVGVCYNYLVIQDRGGEMTTKIDSQLLKGVLTGCILQLLLKEELYGYTLSERLADNGFSDISNGTIYPLLLSMEKKGWIVGQMRESETGPKRKYYAVTALGQEELLHFKYQWQLLKKNVNQVIGDEENE